MTRNTAVVSISLHKDEYLLLEKLSKDRAKNRSEMIRELIVAYKENRTWDEIFTWGRKTKEKFSIQSEEDIMKLIHD